MSELDQILQYAAQSGVEKLARQDVAALAREYGPQALNILGEIMKNKKVKPQARIAAAKELLDRGYGRPTIHIDPTAKSDLELEAAAKQIMLQRGLVVEAQLVSPPAKRLGAPKRKNNAKRRTAKK